METGLRGRVVLVTGASTGIGAATARAFGKEGARVALTYRANEDVAAQVAAEVVAAGGEALTVPLDLQKVSTIGDAVDEVIRRWGGVDVLVANAVRWGGSAPDPNAKFEDVPTEEWRAMMAANVVGTAEVVRRVLPSMRARRWGRIVLVSSGVAEEGLPGPGPYGTAKSALHGMARALAWNAGGDGILANVVAPGFTLTERNAGGPERLIEALAEGTPSRRLSTPDDIAPLLVFLGSAANGNLTGELVREGTSAARAPHAAM